MQAWREVVAAAISAVKPDEPASNFQQRNNAGTSSSSARAWLAENEGSLSLSADESAFNISLETDNLIPGYRRSFKEEGVCLRLFTGNSPGLG